MLFQQTSSPHCAVKGAFARSVGSVEIMDLCRPIQGKPRQEAVIVQESGPCIINEIAVGLDAILNSHARLAIFLFQLKEATVKIKSSERRLPTLKQKGASTFRLFHGGGNQSLGRL